MQTSTTLPISRALTAAILTMLLALVFTRPAIAQHEYDVWYFGYGLKLDFSGGTPILSKSGAMSALEGCASICDPATGAPLFYSNGCSVWDRTDQQMPNGSGLRGASSSAQSALIVPAPGHPNLYYIFTTGAADDSLSPNGLDYSIVDMSLRGGLGDVTLKNVPLLSGVSEHQTAVRVCDGGDFWVIAHRISGNTFEAFRVTPSGVNTTPVVSLIGPDLPGYGDPMGSPGQGVLKASPDGRKLAMTLGDGSLELFRFDRATGIISDYLDLVSWRWSRFFHYGVSFSPDGSKVYTSGYDGLLQYSLESGDPRTIATSEMTISTLAGADLQLSPDGKIYRRTAVKNRWAWISVITSPNAAGKACGLIEQTNQTGQGGNSVSYGLPNNIDALRPGACAAAIITSSTTSICRGEPMMFDGSTSIGSRWEWSFEGGSPGISTEASPTVAFTTPGDRRVRLIMTGDGDADTATRSIHVLAGPAVDAGPDLPLCEGRCVELTPEISGGEAPYRYHWSPPDGLSCIDCLAPRACPSVSTTYHLEVTDDLGCRNVDSVTITVGGSVVTHVHAPRDLSVQPGMTADVPVVADDPLDLSVARTMTITLRYDRSMMRPLPTDKTSGSLTTATILDGWNSLIIADQPGLLSIQLSRTPAATITGRAAGTLLRLRFATFTSASSSAGAAPSLASELPVEIESDDTCLAFDPKPGLLTLKLCGLAYRMIEMSGAKYALSPIAPNPVHSSTDIHFQLGLDGPTRVEILDAAGRLVATLLDGHLDAGSYGITWDAAAIAEGVYYCRVTSGTWSEVEKVVVGN